VGELSGLIFGGSELLSFYGLSVFVDWQGRCHVKHQFLQEHQGVAMSYAHHPHVFTHEWFVLHPQWLAKLKKYGPVIGGVALLVGAALLIWFLYAAFDMPLQGEEAATAVADELFVATGLSGYIPPQYLVPELQAPLK
jgi:hypothetical protein